MALQEDRKYLKLKIPQHWIIRREYDGINETLVIAQEHFGVDGTFVIQKGLAMAEVELLKLLREYARTGKI